MRFKQDRPFDWVSVTDHAEYLGISDQIRTGDPALLAIPDWLGKDGRTQERIFDIAFSGGRNVDADGRCKTSVGSTIDVANTTYTNAISVPMQSVF